MSSLAEYQLAQQHILSTLVLRVLSVVYINFLRCYV